MTGKNTETEKLSRNNGPKLCKCGKRHIFINSRSSMKEKSPKTTKPRPKQSNW